MNGAMNRYELTKVGRNAYRMEDVDAYLDRLEAEIKRLTAQRDELENKMIVLADKIEEYRADEDSLRAALLGAQRFGDKIVKDAKAQAEEIQQLAERKAADAVAAVRGEVEKERAELLRLQKENSRFRASLLALYEEQVKMIKRLPGEDFVEEKPAEEPQKTLEEKSFMEQDILNIALEAE